MAWKEKNSHKFALDLSILNQQIDSLVYLLIAKWKLYLVVVVRWAGHFVTRIRWTPSFVWWWVCVCGSKGQFTLELEGPWLVIMWLVKKLEMVQVHFTWDFEGLRDQKILNGWNFILFTWLTTWQEVDIVSWFTRYAIGPIKKRWVYRKNRSHGSQLNWCWMLELLHYQSLNIWHGSSTWSGSPVHQILRPINCKFGFLFHTVRPLDDFQEPLNFVVTTLGLHVKKPWEQPS